MKTLTLLDQGKVIFDGSQHDFVSRFVPEDKVVFTLSNPVDDNLARSLQRYNFSADDCVVSVSVAANDPVGKLVSVVAAHADVVDMTRSEATLNDAIRGAYAEMDDKGERDNR